MRPRWKAGRRLRTMETRAREVARHWDEIYGRRLPTEVSWYQDQPTVSLALLDALGVTADQPTVDVGGGASVLVDRLLDRRFADVSVLDVSAAALAHAKKRLAERAELVHWLREDVLTWRPGRRYGIWHDRAVFHFLVEEKERRAYLAALRAALIPEGRVVIGTFAGDGPQQCSGLPVQRYDPRDLAAVFGADFEVVEHRRDEHHTPGGTEQPFTWVGMVWRPELRR
jgi:SAM-dependent methyltransferase